MKNFSSRFLKSFPCLILSVIFLYVPPCFADKGVFAARVTPDEIFADDLPVNIAVKAEIGDVPFNESVKVYQTTENGASIRLLCSMRFDKRRYFTGQFTIADKRSDPFCFKIVAVYNNKEKIAGPVQKVALLVRVPAADIAKAKLIARELTLKCKEYRKRAAWVDIGKLLAEDAKKYKGLEFSWNGGASMLYKGIRTVITPSDCQAPGEASVD